MSPWEPSKKFCANPPDPEEFVAGRKWVFASTMADNPHWYTVRGKNDADMPVEWFSWFVALIREEGHRAKFGGSWYVELIVADHKYWTMGWPCEETLILNRKPLEPGEGIPQRLEADDGSLDVPS